jgi:primosomal protein N' (replication factor Y)
VCSSRVPGPEATAAAAVRQRLDAPGCSVLGPAPLFRLKGRERAQILIKAPAGEDARATVVRAVRRAVDGAAGDRSLSAASFSVDVDPQ